MKSKVPHNFLQAKSIAPGNRVDVLYEDDYCAVFYKPPGLLVIPGPKAGEKTLVGIVNEQFIDLKGQWKFHPCHRIDRETSGAVIFAKGKQFQRRMMDLFKRRAVTKKYIAFVHGKLPKAHGEFRSPVKDVYRKQFRRRSAAAGAVTEYNVWEARKRFSIVEVMPITGRTNQIRIHFSQAGHPLVGERRYAFARDYPLKFRRTALHAAGVEWIHPVYQKKISVTSELPKDMQEFILKN